MQTLQVNLFKVRFLMIRLGLGSGSLCTSSVVMFRFLVGVKKSRSVFKFLDITVPPIGAFLRRVQ